MTKLCIAEKPSLGKAIAAVIGVTKREDGYLVCKDGTIVTWAFGHLYEQGEPEDYNQAYKKWSFEHLPIIPEKWIIKPKDDKGVKKQIATIKKLLSSCSSVINAGDPDREGQLLVDEILEELGNKKPVERIWLASLDEKSVLKALTTMRSNNEYKHLKDAAEARSRADWLAGMNYTRAVTLVGQQSGIEGVLSIGRVQTPTLTLIVNRDNEIDNFKSVPYFVPGITLSHRNGTFKATLVIDEKIQTDEFGRITDPLVAKKIVDQVNSKKGIVQSWKSVLKKQPQPMPYSLSALQKEASSQLGMSAANVLATAQKLYEAKLTSYPRTDCGFLPEEQFSDAQNILDSLLKNGFQKAKDADASLKSKAWNTSKITAHHGMLPTGQSAAGLTGDEKDIYDMICNRYIEQFYPDYQYVSQQAISEIGDFQWKSEGQKTIDEGWKKVSGKDIENNPLPDIEKGDDVSCVEASVENKKTTPPPRFTDGTIIEAMAGVHKFVTDPKIRDRLKENSGIGTEATRAGILEVLVFRKYIQRKGKQLISTSKGKELIALIPDSLKDPGLTALWEDFLEKIAAGKLDPGEFIEQQKIMLPKMLNKIKMITFKAPPNSHKCPKCNSVLKQWTAKNNKKFKYWSCMGDKTHPAYFDKDGKPDGEIKRKD